MPSPIDTELRVHASPVPTQTVLALLGSIATAPIDWTACLSNTGLNVGPPSGASPPPPEAEPTNRMVLPPTIRPATAAIRPLIAAEPMLRESSPESVPASRTAFSLGGGGGAAAATALA